MEKSIYTSIKRRTMGTTCEFFIQYKGYEDELLTTAKKGITEAGGKILGDNLKGSIELPIPGKDIEGTYTITPPTINISITKKSRLVSCERIEEELAKYMDPPVDLNATNV